MSAEHSMTSSDEIRSVAHQILGSMEAFHVDASREALVQLHKVL